jgi:predicted dehydrogenase
MEAITRRRFLGISAAAAAGAIVRPASGGSADTLRVAVLGARVRGIVHAGNFAGRHGCQVTTICDVDESVIAPAMRAVEKAQGKPPHFEPDLRRVMDDRSIDIVTIALPNHWHALAAMWAMQAGKDVYLEKPVSHNVLEGRLLVQAARKFGRICQAGMQCRSHPGMRQAIDYVRAGRLGHVKLVRGLCYKWRPAIGRVEGEPKRPGWYDLWCGPAPDRPMHRRQLHYDWHWQWDYGNGELGNQGVHQLDLARWGLGRNTAPRAVTTVGGRLGPLDDGETPNTSLTWFDYGDSEILFEVRGLPTSQFEKTKIGVIFYGSDATLVCSCYTGGTVLDHKGQVIQRFDEPGDHYGNFVDAVRSHRADVLNAQIEEGNQSSLLVHLANISYRLAGNSPWSGAKAVLSDRSSQDAVARMLEHLHADGVAPDRLRVGPRLEFDAVNERFARADANAFLSRPYRQGFAMPSV